MLHAHMAVSIQAGYPPEITKSVWSLTFWDHHNPDQKDATHKESNQGSKTHYPPKRFHFFFLKKIKWTVATKKLIQKFTPKEWLPRSN